MRNLVLIAAVAICVFAGCAPWSTDRSTDGRLPDYELAQDIVVDVWREKFGFITNGAAEALAAYTLLEVRYNELRECQSQETGVTIGCHRFINDQETIQIYYKLNSLEKECTLIHELIHLLSLYEFNDSQPDHGDPALWNEFGDYSVEAIACKRLKETLSLEKMHY